MNDGYPLRYTAPAGSLLPVVLDKPPWGHDVWSFEVTDILLDDWLGKTAVDRAAVAQCHPGEWLLVAAWDES